MGLGQGGGGDALDSLAGGEGGEEEEKMSDSPDVVDKPVLNTPMKLPRVCDTIPSLNGGHYSSNGCNSIRD